MLQECSVGSSDFLDHNESSDFGFILNPKTSLWKNFFFNDERFFANLTFYPPKILALPLIRVEKKLNQELCTFLESVQNCGFFDTPLNLFK